MNPMENSSEVFLLSSYKEKVVLHLPTELDGLHLSAMPAAEGDVVVIDVPVASLNLTQQSALGNLLRAEDSIWADIVSQYREQ